MAFFAIDSIAYLARRYWVSGSFDYQKQLLLLKKIVFVIKTGFKMSKRAFSRPVF
jgi:hypothetical protein